MAHVVDELSPIVSLTHCVQVYNGLDTSNDIRSHAAHHSSIVNNTDMMHSNMSSSPPTLSSLMAASNNNDTADNGTASVVSSSREALEVGSNDGDDQDENSDEYDDADEDYELTASFASPNNHRRATLRSTALLPWRPKDRLWCIIFVSLTVIAVIMLAMLIERHDGLFGIWSHGPPPGAVGVGHAAYDTVHSSWLKEYEARLTFYRHRVTGAEFLAFVPDAVRSGPTTESGGGSTHARVSGNSYDPKPDKVFGVAFRTKPESSTGVPHILEHAVLCGSKKYPSRDPFAHLLKGSLHTFLNAMTYPDRTVYPVASRNRADFRNLMDVYLDAVFHPRAVEEEGWWVLRQEGWRYDVVDSNDNETFAESGDERTLAEKQTRAKFEYKGVVFSEMKGAYSDPEDLLDRITNSLLFPDSPYYFDSGGDPAIIPTLTREEFVAFYKKYYHPTNARLFVAGDEIDVYHALSVSDHYMKPMGYNPDSKKDSVIVYQGKTFETPVSERRPFAVSKSENSDGESTQGFMLCITWLLNTEPLSSMMELAWIVLDSLLLGRPSSYLRKALEDSSLGEEVIGNGVDNQLLQSTFAIGMKGIKNRADVTKLENLIMETLHQLDTRGFTDDDIASSLNTVEFSLREGGGGLRGLEVFFATLTKWNYDLSPKDAIIYEGALKQLKDEINLTGSNIFKQMIHDFLITNNHRVVLELFPSTTLEEDQLKAEEIQIAQAQSKMTDEDYQRIIDDSKKLKQLQGAEETPEVIATNPTLSISDLDSSTIEYPIVVNEDGFKSGIRLITHEVASSGILYVKFGLDISMIPYEDITILPAFVSLLNYAGTSTMTDAAFRNEIGKVSGGVQASLEIMSVNPIGWEDEVKVLPGVNILSMLFINGKCTSDKTSELFSIIGTILTDIDINDSKSILQNSLKASLSSKKSSVASEGHSYADRRIRGRYSVRNFINEKFNGYTSLKDDAAILDSIEANWTAFSQRLGNLKEVILGGNRSGMLLDMTGDAYVLEVAMESAENFLVHRLPRDIEGIARPTPNFRSVPHPWIAAAKKEMKQFNPLQDEGIVVSTQVAYVGEGGPLYDVGEDVHGSASVVSHYLTTGFLWDVIRAKYGAYGAYSDFSSTDGIATFYTYRDPNTPDTTLDLFDTAAESILKDASSETLSRDNYAAITTAVVGTIGSVDGSALSAEAAGFVALIRYLRGESSISRQKKRDQIISTNVNDFVEYANLLKSWSPSKAVVASQTAFDDMSERIGLDFTLLRVNR